MGVLIWGVLVEECGGQGEDAERGERDGGVGGRVWHGVPEREAAPGQAMQAAAAMSSSRPNRLVRMAIAGCSCQATVTRDGLATDAGVVARRP